MPASSLNGVKMKKITILVINFLILVTPFISCMEVQDEQMNIDYTATETANSQKAKKHSRDEEEDNIADGEETAKRRKCISESNDANSTEANLEEETRWNHLPVELQNMVLSFLVQSLNNSIIEPHEESEDDDEDKFYEEDKSLKNLLETYAALSLVNKQFNEFASHQEVFDIPDIVYRLSHFFEHKVNIAAEKNDLKTLKSLLKQGLIVRNFDRAITIASRNRHIKFCKLLIIAGIFEGTRNTMLIHAIYLHDFDTVKNLIKFSKYNPREAEGAQRQYLQDDIPALLIATQIGNIDILKLILDSLPDKNLINYETIEGITALKTACVNGDKEIVELLIEYGADIHQKSQNNFTALDLATRHSEIRNLLLSKGAKYRITPNVIHLSKEAMEALKNRNNIN